MQGQFNLTQSFLIQKTLSQIFCILKEGIEPMWEDEKNRLGGRWLMNLNKSARFSELDKIWLEMVSIMILIF